jgi:hypothetical protein
MECFIDLQENILNSFEYCLDFEEETWLFCFCFEYFIGSNGNDHGVY